MPSRIIPIAEAAESLRRPSAQWGKGHRTDEQGHKFAAPGADPHCGSARVHQSDLPIALAPARNKLAPGSKIFAMGSCFAREIEYALAQRGFTILSRPAEERAVSGYRHDGYAEISLLNRYNTASMLLEFRRLLKDPAVLPDDALLIPAGDDFIEAHYHSIGAAPRAEIAERRRRFWADFQSLRRADAIVITLGVNEAAFDTRSGLYRNVSPLISEVRRRVPIEVHCLSVRDNVRNLRAIRRLIRAEVEGTPTIFLTVSPVPLTATYTDQDVIVANAASKSTLRAAAAEFCAEHPDVIYFPSYEMATGADPAAVFAPDKRHIQKAFVTKIVGQFVARYVDSNDRVERYRAQDQNEGRRLAAGAVPGTVELQEAAGDELGV